jgi:hypothetical protein
MKLKQQILALILLTCCTVHAQINKISCDCPKTKYAGEKADSFLFSNGKTIVLCGYNNPERSPKSFSEFTLSVCGQNSIIDSFHSFIGTKPVITCHLKMDKDTLFIQQVANLPTGKNFVVQPTIWSNEKIYFRDGKHVIKQTVNRNIPKYDQKKIDVVLKSFETSKPGLDSAKMELANQLLMAVISGNATARQYLKEFKTKFGNLQGIFLEEYNDLTAMLELWDKKE